MIEWTDINDEEPEYLQPVIAYITGKSDPIFMLIDYQAKPRYPNHYINSDGTVDGLTHWAALESPK